MEEEFDFLEPAHILEKFMWRLRNELKYNQDFYDMLLKGTIGSSYLRSIIVEFLNSYSEEVIINFFNEYIKCNCPRLEISSAVIEKLSTRKDEFSNFMIFEIVMLFFQKYTYYHFLNECLNITRREDHTGKPDLLNPDPEAESLKPFYLLEREIQDKINKEMFYLDYGDDKDSPF